MMTDLQAVVLDLAGTVVDFGSMAPVEAFVSVFAAEGVLVAPAEARLHMGLRKREHMIELLSLPGVSARWQAVKGGPPTEDDIERLRSGLVDALAEAIPRNQALTPGAAHISRDLLRSGIKVGITTGYNRAAATPLLAAVAAQGFQAQAVVCAGETERGRPYADQMLEALRQLDVHEPYRCVKVDDTISGVREGLAAGAWTVGVTVSGNAGGMRREAWIALDSDARQAVRRTAEAHMDNSGAHTTISFLADLMPVLDRIGRRVARGERP